MKNLSPHRTFRGPSTIKGSMRPFYQHPWPGDLPPQCSVCGTEFRTGWNLSIGPNRIGRFLRKAAYWAVLPGFFLGFILPAAIPGIYDAMHEKHAAWLFLFVTFAPAPLLFIASQFTSITRHVACKKCGWNRDYPGAKPTPIPPPEKSS
jgi:hypothetical protein